MNHKNQLIFSSALIAFLLLSFGRLAAEGTKQLSPTAQDSAMLHTNASGFGNFASFTSLGTTSALNVDIKDFTTEKLTIGLSAEADDFGTLNSSYTFRIVDSVGNVVFGPFTIGLMNDNAETWAQACGPDFLVPGGYSTNTGLFPYSVFMPTYNGTYTLQFDDGAPNNIVNILWYDFTVVSNMTTEQPGRLWSRNWAIRTPPRNPNQLPECQFDREFNGTFYSYTMDGFVSRIDFNNSGFQGLSFNVAFGDTGPGNTGNVIEDRRSVNDANATANAADHMVFLNEPDSICFPSSEDQCGSVALISVSCEAPDSFCINVGITKPGQIEVILDFNDNGIYDLDTTDVLIAMILDEADTICLPWNGLKGDGTPIAFGEEVPTVIRYSQGVQHYAAFDVEFMKNGFCVQTIRPICPGVNTSLLYFDDTNITDDVVTVTIDEGDPHAGPPQDPKVELNGCQCQVDSCRTWSNFQIGDPPSGNCTGTPFGYGENATLNTWWYASTIIIDDISLPFVQVQIIGDSAICEGTTTTFTADVFPDTSDFTFMWTGPGGFMANTQSTGPIGTAGTYYVTITDDANCSAIDSAVLIVFDNPETSIAFMCVGNNQQNANVDLTVLGGTPPYTYIWSNGAMTQDLTNVPPGEYFVTVTDANGCQAVDSITVEGCCELIITCPPVDGGTFQCESQVPPANMSGIVVVEFCDDVTISLTNEFDNEGSGCPASPLVITRIYTVQDGAGNTQSCTINYTVIDTIVPITCPANITVQCASQVPAPTPAALSTTDNCGGLTTVTFIGDVISNQTCPNRFTITRTYQATDACLNTATCTQTITVFDNTAPTLTCPVNVTVQCASQVPAPNTALITTTDNCGGSSTVTVAPDVISNQTCPNRFTITRVYIATDACGNTGTCSQTITVFDNTAPSITCPVNVTVQCASQVPPANTGAIVTSDNCGGTSTVTVAPDVITNQTCANRFTITRVYTATDACGNSATCSQIITVFDSTVPTLTCPANVTVQCASLVPAANTAAVTTTDNCGGASTVTVAPDVISNQTCPNRFTITRVYTATDVCGNSATCSQIITVFDNTPPTLTCPANVTVQCASLVPATNTAGVTTTDNCGGTSIVTVAPDVISNQTCPDRFTVTRIYTATDACGNSATCAQIITVFDNTGPVLTCPANVTVQCASLVPAANTGLVTVTDNCGGSSTVTVAPDVISNQTCPNRFTITRVYTATDACGNTGTCAQIITVFDNTPPTLTCPGNVTVQCASQVPPANFAAVTATDNCGGSSTITVAPDVITNQTCVNRFTITRVYTATDACGNTATCAQIITVFDNTPPTITCPANVTVQCAGAVPPPNTGSVTTSDNCGGPPTVTFADVTTNLTCPNSFTVVRTYTATDACGNTATCTQTITVSDTTVPTITCPAGVTVSCANAVPPVNTGSVTTSDNCGAVTVTHVGDVITNQTCPNRFTLTRTYRATDACGNSATCAQTIIVNDVTGPTAICNDFMISFVDETTVTITPEDIDNGSFDNCGGTVTLSLSQTEFQCEDFTGQMAIPVTLTVTDECGNTSTCTAQVFGQGGALEIDCPSDITVHLGPGECVAFVNYVVTAESLCGSNVVTITQIDNSGLTSGDAFPIGVTIQTYQATNGFDTVECSFTITVIEADIPVVMACNDVINISVDANCEAHIFADMILEGDQYGCYDDFIITIEDFGTDTGWIVVSGLPLNECYTVTITDPESGSSCWGTICLEDKLPPQIICACPIGGGGDTCVVSCLDVDQLLDGIIPPDLLPEVIENCGEFELDILDIEVNDPGCGEGNIIITWIVTDDSGMTATCAQEFTVEPLSIDDVIFPSNYTGECGTSSHPNVTGWPQVDGIDLTDQNSLCNLFLGYWDKVLQDCGGGTKIVRTWTILDWCTLDIIEFVQIIKLSDLEGPQLTCPANISVGTDFWYCFANVSVPKPIAFDDCSDVVNFSLTSQTGTVVQFGNNFVINGLPLGPHVVVWTVTDLCGNSSTCSFIITVVDNVAPVANCDHHTIVSLTNDGPFGITLVPATVFDDGSYDNCGPVTFRARRMDSCIDFDWTTEGACIDHIPGGIPPVNSRDRGTVHRTCVPFACCDVGADEPIMVELEVTDASGNVNYCMVEVEVQDKISPFIICPPDIIVSCDFWFAVEEGTFTDAEGNANGMLDEDVLSPVFGNMWDAFQFNDDESVRRDIIINDPGNNTISQPHFWGIDGWADDNCEVNLSVRVRIIDDCSGDDLPANAPPGAVRLIERRFSASDGNDGIAPGTCTQRIWVVDFNPFFITDINCNNANPNDGVIWPCDIVLTTCPDNLNGTGEPTVFDDACSLIGIAFEDTRFNFVDGACFKILRKWSVIDWCQYDPFTGEGLWMYTQVIKVHDHEGPAFVDCPQEPVVLCVADPGVSLPDNNQAFLGEENPLSSSCSAHLNLCKTVIETCSDFVKYDVKIYPFNGSSFIQVKPTTTVPVDTNSNQAVLCFNTRESTIQSVRLNGIPYNSPWCGDYHRILWSVEDDCGNFSFCEYLFRLEDCKQPSPVCINGLSTVVMPVGCVVTIWAKDFDASSFDDCTPSDELLFSFSGTSYQPSMTYDTFNIPAFNTQITIQIWVADGGTDDNCNNVISWEERNKDFCTTTIMFTDNTQNECNTVGSIIFEGDIVTEKNITIENVKVELQTETETVYSMSTSDNGHYTLVVPPVEGQRYRIEPSRNDNHKNGVSTLDLVGIQKHLLGKEFFNSPYQYIAADANNSEGVSAIDLIEIRKLILGVYTKFPNNQSWRFVDKNAGFADVKHPWPFEEVINIQYDGNSLSNLDFVGVKIGDVNNSVQANALQILPRNDSRMLFLKAEADKEPVAGQMVNVTLTIPERLLGFQWTLETDGLEFIGIESNDISIDNQHLAVHQKGRIAMSWHQEDLNFEKNEITMVLSFRALRDGKVNDMLSVTSSITTAEAYTPQYEVVNVSLENQSSGEAADFALYQNEPNPWSGSTLIRFDLPESGTVQLTIFDTDGKVLKVIEKLYDAGTHSLSLAKKDLNANGVLYYRLESGNYSATKKMIRIE